MDPATAKEFLISKVVQEAASSHVQLSDVERKMLYFTEAYPSLPDIIEVNAEFERNYDSDEYERKIAQLLRSARARASQSSPSGEQEWRDALNTLRKEDHYILVMVSLAFGRDSAAEGHRLRDLLIYTAVGIGVVVVLVWWSFGR
jgi:hypothetical protein